MSAADAVRKPGSKRWAESLCRARERMAKLVKEGKSLDEVYAAKPFADFDARMKAGEQQAKAFMRVVYMTVKE